MIKCVLFLSQMRIKDPKYTFKIFALTDPVTCMLSVKEMSVNKQFSFSFDFCALIKLRIGTHLNHHRGTDKSLARPGRKHDRKHVRDARDFNNIETRAVMNRFSCKARRRRKFTPFRQKH